MRPQGMNKAEYHNDSRKVGDAYVHGRRHNGAGDLRDFRAAKKRERRQGRVLCQYFGVAG